LGIDEAVPTVVVWFAHRWVLPYSLGSGVAMAVLGVTVGLQNPASVGALALSGFAIASIATTEYRILSLVGSELVVMHSGRFRQVATSVLDRLSSGVRIERLGGNLVTSEWTVGDRMYSTYRRSDLILSGIAVALSDS